MTTDELINALERMESETGSLADSLCCLGCGHEHNCGVHGCAVGYGLRTKVGTQMALPRFRLWW